MEQLENLRKEIDVIDEQLAKLFEQRMHLVTQIAQIKKENNIAVYDKKREESMLKKNINNITDEALKQYYLMFLNDLMKISKKYQEEIL